MQDTEETRTFPSREVSDHPNETGYGSSSTLHCCEILESGEPNTSEKDEPADKPYDLCFTSKFWRKNMAISKDAMHLDFILLGPLVAALPLLFQTDLYSSRSVFIIFALYGTTGVMFLKNLISLWTYSQASRATITVKTVALHLVLVMTFLVGVMVMAYYLAAGDRSIRVWESRLGDNNLTIAPKKYSLVWGATAAVHSLAGVLWVYAVTVPLAVLLVLSESLQNRDQDQFCLTSCRVKTLGSLLGVGLSLAEAKFRQWYYLEETFFSTSTPRFIRNFLLIGCCYLPIVLVKELEFYQLSFPNKLDLPPSKQLLWASVNYGLTAATGGIIATVALIAVNRV